MKYICFCISATKTKITDNGISVNSLFGSSMEGGRSAVKMAKAGGILGATEAIVFDGLKANM